MNITPIKTFVGRQVTYLTTLNGRVVKSWIRRVAFERQPILWRDTLGCMELTAAGRSWVQAVEHHWELGTVHNILILYVVYSTVQNLS
jgi:hypothetical protein